MEKLTFDIEDELDTNYLHGFLEECQRENASDEDIILAIQRLYDSSCWFSVISFAEQAIYG